MSSVGLRYTRLGARRTDVSSTFVETRPCQGRTGCPTEGSTRLRRTTGGVLFRAFYPRRTTCRGIEGGVRTHFLAVPIPMICLGPRWKVRVSLSKGKGPIGGTRKVDSEKAHNTRLRGQSQILATHAGPGVMVPIHTSARGAGLSGAALLSTFAASRGADGQFQDAHANAPVSPSRSRPGHFWQAVHIPASDVDWRDVQRPWQSPRCK